MIEMFTKQDAYNDTKALLSWLASVLFDFGVLGSASGVISFFASLLGCIYLYHRIVKIKIEVEDARLNKQIKEIELDTLINEVNKKSINSQNITKNKNNG